MSNKYKIIFGILLTVSIFIISVIFFMWLPSQNLKTQLILIPIYLFSISFLITHCVYKVVGRDHINALFKEHHEMRLKARGIYLKKEVKDG